VSVEEVAQKFRKCAAFSVKPISDKNIEEIIRVIGNLEMVSDVSSVVRMI